MDSEAYQKMLKRIQNTDLNRDPGWRKARQAELDEIGLSTGKKYTFTSNWLDSPFPADRKKAWPISSRVNSPRNDDPSNICRVATWRSTSCWARIKASEIAAERPLFSPGARRSLARLPRPPRLCGNLRCTR